MVDYNWDRIAKHYRRYRPGPPRSHYDLLRCFGLGLPGQQILDLGTGPGLLACQFARQGAQVVGIDSSAGQIEQARLSARKKGLDVSFLVAAAEELPQLARPIDLAVACMCWGSFDQSRVLERLIPQMVGTGQLVLSTFCWLTDNRAGRLTLELLTELGIALQHDTRRPLGQHPRANDPRLKIRAMIHYEEPIAFDLDAWIGRILASRKLSMLDEETSRNLARQLREHLARRCGEQFSINHGIEIQIYGLSSRSATA
ncbi:MAG: methyltransferase domain-containing protein [Gammaproteobacteria bacterium]|nr:methyltransferase domain-containing protein [Gammaproteobacteria bacterium]NNJ84754.1 methyltransferase domain-containing protein [Gammaproteobacteria bacterium]